MAAKVLFWFEESTAGLNFSHLDRNATYFGCHPVIIDLTRTWKARAPGQFPIIYHSFDEALADLSDHAWVFLHPDGPTILDEFEHPADPVVYAVGSNRTGFGKAAEELQGSLVRLRNPEVVNDYQALFLTLHDRYLFQNGRRA